MAQDLSELPLSPTIEPYIFPNSLNGFGFEIPSNQGLDLEIVNSALPQRSRIFIWAYDE
jgi:hypothetical protein